MLPLFKVIKTQFPDTHITALVAPVNADFAQEVGFIDDVLVYRKNNFWDMLQSIKHQQFDASISGFIDTRLGLLLWLSGISKRIAPATKVAQIFFNQRVVQRRSRVEKTEIDYNLELGKVLYPELNTDFSRPLIDVSVNSSHIDHSIKSVIFHVGSGGSSDGNLEIHDYLRLAKKASQQNNTQVIFSFGPDDAAAKRMVQEHLDFQAKLLDSTGSLMDFCRLLSTCTLFVSTSTGPMHLAGAVNANTLSFFGDHRFSSSDRWATVSDANRQHNVTLPADYNQSHYHAIEQIMMGILT